MWQNIIVAIIGIGIVGKLIYNVYKFIFVKNENNQPFCTGCTQCKPTKHQ